MKKDNSMLKDKYRDKLELNLNNKLYYYLRFRHFSDRLNEFGSNYRGGSSWTRYYVSLVVLILFSLFGLYVTVILHIYTFVSVIITIFISYYSIINIISEFRCLFEMHNNRKYVLNNIKIVNISTKKRKLKSANYEINQSSRLNYQEEKDYIKSGKRTSDANGLVRLSDNLYYVDYKLLLEQDQIDIFMKWKRKQLLSAICLILLFSGLVYVLNLIDL